MAILATFEDEELDRLYTETALTNVLFDTGVVGNAQATQQRTVNRYDGIRTYSIQYGGMSPTEKTRLEEFFITKFGRAIGFRFYPPSDRDFLNDVIGVGDGSMTRFYLKRNYVSRNRFITRRILKPIYPLLTVTVNNEKVRIDDPITGTEITPAGSYAILDNPITVNWNDGYFDFETAPPNGQLIRAAQGQYHVPVYFDTDGLSATDYGPFADADSVQLIEIVPAALDAVAQDLPVPTLAFELPLSGSEVPATFTARLTGTNLTKVHLYLENVFWATITSAGPTYTFSGVTRPTTPDGSFRMEAVGTNASGQIVVAGIDLLSAVGSFRVMYGAPNNVVYGAGNQVVYGG